MAKVFQVVKGICYWLTPFKSVAETLGKYTTDCLFVEAPDFVFEGWGYQTTDDDGNPLVGNARFIKPTPPDGFFYDDKTGNFYPDSEIPRMLEELQNEKQNINKLKFAQTLANNPLTWTDGKTYGVTLEDQTEIQLNIAQYKSQVEAGVKDPILMWHAQHEPSTVWTLDDLNALVAAIAAHIRPWFTRMQENKEKIYATTNFEEVHKLTVSFGDEPITEVPETGDNEA